MTIDPATLLADMPNIAGFLIATFMLYRALIRSLELTEKLASELIACYKSKQSE